MAHVFLSYDAVSWTHLGNVSYNNTSLDLQDISYQSHANYIKLVFVGDNHSDFLNISGIHLGRYERYYEPFTITLDTSRNTESWSKGTFSVCMGTLYVRLMLLSLTNVASYRYLLMFAAIGLLLLTKGCKADVSPGPLQ